MSPPAEVPGKDGGGRNRLALQFTMRFALMALVPLAVAMGIAYEDARQALTVELTEKLRGVAAREALVLTSTLRGRIGEAQLVAAAPEALAALAEPPVKRPFTEFAGTYAAINNVGRVYLVDRVGQMVASAGRGPQSEGSMRSPELANTQMGRVFERATTVLEAEVSDYLVHPPTGKPAAFVAAPLLDHGILVGAIILQLDHPGQLGVRPDYTGLGGTGELVLATAAEREGQVTYVAATRFDSNAAFRRTVDREAEESAVWQAAKGGRGFGEFVDYRGEKVFGVWRYLPALRMGIVVKMDVREAFHPVRRLGQSFLIILAVASGLIVAASLFTSRLVVLPIRRLRDAAARLAAEGPQRGLHNLPSPANEIGDLSASLQAMSEKLSAAFEKLEMANVTLEAKVLQRTEALTEKNQQLESALAELKSAQDRMVAQARMASLGQLTKGVAHEIKNPLNFVNNFATLSKELCNELRDVIHESPDVPPPVTQEADDLLEIMRDNLLRIESHGRRADLIVSGMLEHSRAATSQEMRETDLNHAVRTSIEVAQRMAQAAQNRDADGTQTVGLGGPRIHLDLEASMPSINCFPGDLCRAVVNVVNNALWAVGHGPQNNGHEPAIWVSTRLTDHHAIITIRDNGVGMDPQTLLQATTPFFTTKPTGEGTGLGLSLAYEVVTELHNGEFVIQSEKGSGTTVEMKISRLLGE